jgi:hypothetical protein
VSLPIYQVLLSSCAVTSNTAVVDGAGVAVMEAASVMLANASIVRRNEAMSTGGSFVVSGDLSTLSAFDSRVHANIAVNGAAFAVTEGGVLHLRRVNMTDNAATRGGGVWIGTRATVDADTESQV